MQHPVAEPSANSKQPVESVPNLEQRTSLAVGLLWRPRPGPPLSALCRDLDLVVDLQRCAQQEPERLAALQRQHAGALELWLFGVALGCAGFGLVDEAPGLLDAVPGIAAGADGRAEMLNEIVQWQAHENSRARKEQGRVTWTAA